jgi:hypothetical protein
MDLADAALVHVAECDGYRRVFTLDERDFAMSRVAGRERLTVLSNPPRPRRPRGVRS